MAGDALLLMTHFLDERIVAHYRRLRREAGGLDVVVLYNRSDDPAPGFPLPPDVDICAFGIDNIRALGYPAKGRRLNARDVELFVIHFHRRHPGYRRVWVVEYDVEFTGPWGLLLDAFAPSPADLLATTVHRFETNPAWPNWASLQGPAGPPARDAMLRAFMPLCRLSADALAVLHQRYAKGWHGHYEGTVPTLLAAAGMAIEDIGGDGEFVAPGNRNRFYTNTPSANHLAPGSFVFRPVRTTPGEEPGRLWHPVKPPALTGGWETGRRRRLSGWARSNMMKLTKLIAK